MIKHNTFSWITYTTFHNQLYPNNYYWSSIYFINNRFIDWYDEFLLLCYITANFWSVCSVKVKVVLFIPKTAVSAFKIFPQLNIAILYVVFLSLFCLWPRRQFYTILTVQKEHSVPSSSPLLLPFFFSLSLPCLSFFLTPFSLPSPSLSLFL